METASSTIASLLKHAHSGLRWVLLLALVFAIVNAFIKWQGKKEFTADDKKLNLLAFIFSHLQLTVGLVLYFLSPNVIFEASSMKDPVMRFFLVEHLAIMVVAVVVITVGYGRSKRATESSAKFKAAFTFFLIGLILILAGIPWPFQQYGASWF